MTYQGSYPPGQGGYSSQPQAPHTGSFQYANGGQQYAATGAQNAQGLPQYGSGAPQFANGGYADMNQNAYNYNNLQYSQPGAYNQPPAQQQRAVPHQTTQYQPVQQRQLQQPVQQQPATQYYAPNPSRQSQDAPPVPASQPTMPPVYQQRHQSFQGYDGANSPLERQPQGAAPGGQFVNPSFLQQRPSPATSYRQSPVQAQVQGRPPQSQSNAQPIPNASMASPVMHQQQFPSSVPAVRELQSPRVQTLKTPSQVPRTKTNGSVSKRPSSVHSSTKSPSVGHASLPYDTLPLLICLAEDCFSKARESIQQTGRALHPDTVKEYHKLMATGLQCLAVALQNNKIQPRLEARVRLRYAKMLMEETLNHMDAETTLLKGISLCDKHRFTDLKFCMQYLHVKVLFQKSPKAAFISIDSHIADCTTYKHIQWVYAFLFLKAAFYNEAGTGSDRPALENLQRLASIANARGDRAICVAVSLLEGLAHLRACTTKPDAILRVQTCIANASKYQLEDTARWPQLEVLLLLLDLACSLYHKRSEECSAKLQVLTRRMEEIRENHEWNPLNHNVLLPIRKPKQLAVAQSQVVSPETSDVLQQGDNEVDYLVLPMLAMRRTWVVTYTLHGIVSLTRSSVLGRSSELWQEALKILKDSRFKNPVTSLSDSVKLSESDNEMFCYLKILIGLQAATLLDWAKVKKIIDEIDEAKPTQRYIRMLHLYLKGAFLQGVAKTDEALEIYEHPLFDLSTARTPARASIEDKIAILATFNRLWILEHASFRDEAQTSDLIEQLKPLCEDHPDPEIRASYHMVLGAALAINPPLSSNQLKQHISRGAHLLRDTQNKQLIAMSLSIMRHRLFGGVVGLQANKSAKAAVAQTTMSGNVLWQSVAHGMLAETYETDGKLAEARAARGDGIRLANEAAERTRDPFI